MELLAERPAAKVRPRVKRPSQPRNDASISLRVSTYALGLIDTAAAAIGKSRTEFMVETARKHAVDVLLDQRLFELPNEQHDAFMRALDNPPQPSKQLVQLFATKAPWE